MTNYLPSAKELLYYQKLDPSFPERIMALAEKEQKDYCALRAKSLENLQKRQARRYARQRLQLILCFVLSLVFAFVSALFFCQECLPAGMLFAAGAILAVPGHFMGARFKKT